MSKLPATLIASRRTEYNICTRIDPTRRNIKALNANIPTIHAPVLERQPVNADATNVPKSNTVPIIQQANTNVDNEPSRLTSVSTLLGRGM